MKKITLLIFLLTTALSFGQELITNGGFESDNGGEWSGSKVTISAADPYTGLQRANLGNDSGAIRQNFTVTAGVEYTVSFWWAFNNASSTTDAWITIKKQSDNSNISPTPITLPKSTGDWTYETFTFTSATETALYFNVFKDNRNSVDPTSLNNSMKFDDVSVVPTSTASLEDLYKFNFAFYPNPAKDNLRLSSAKPIENVQLYNILGQQVLNKDVNESKPNINVSNLSKGVYIMKVKIEDTVGSFKFIKE